MLERILQANPGAGYEAHRKEIDAAVLAVLKGGRYLLGPETEAFESEFAAYLNAKHAISAGSGTEAIHLALAACGIGSGDEVITVSHTATATISAIELAGASPVFVDIDPASYTIDPALIEPAITERTRAILPVHLYGHPADMESICRIGKKYRLFVIEDCSQSLGAAIGTRKTGCWGDISAFSFYPTKNLGAFGDAGMVVTGETGLAKNVASFRQYGWDEDRISNRKGWNARMDEIQAAVLRVKLKYLDTDNSLRHAIANRYNEALAETDVRRPSVSPNRTHAYHQYVVRVPNRHELQDALQKLGIMTAIHYAVPVHLHPAYKGRIAISGSLTETEKASHEILSLPLYPQLPLPSVDRVAASIRHFF